MRKSLRILAEEAARAYNEKRSPEAKAEIVDINETEGVIKVKIEGPFCWTCGVDDWLVDYQYELKSLGVVAKIVKYSIDYENEKAEAEFKIAENLS